MGKQQIKQAIINVLSNNPTSCDVLASRVCGLLGVEWKTYTEIIQELQDDGTITTFKHLGSYAFRISSTNPK